MKRNEKETAKRVQTLAICGCLCLLAVGAGVTYRAFEKRPQTAQEEFTAPMPMEQPVTAVQTPSIEQAILERNKRSNDPGEAPDAEKEAEKTTEKKVEKPVFAYPVEGEVLLPYSIDHAIYDPTLDQYRTNAGISLSAEQGTAVKAAADGVVKEIREDTEAGLTVTIAHAENWLTTYGQLEQTVKVKEGETVKQGQTIGSVAAPTKYGVALGSHLDFAMEQDGEPKDPSENLKRG